MVGPALDDGRPFFPPIYAPYKCAKVPYNSLGFAEFPDRSGWAILDRPKDPNDRMKEGFLLRRQKCSDHGTPESTDCGVDEKAAFVQAWLFFGALTEVLKTAGIALQVDDFLAQLNRSTIVSTSRLHSYGQLWALNEDKLGVDGRARRARKVCDIIREGEFFLSRWAPEGYDDNCLELSSSRNLPGVTVWSEQRRSIHQVYFSVAVVFLFLRLSAYRIFPDDFPKMHLLVPNFGDYLFGWAYGKADDSLNTGFTLPKGQCPSETQMLRETLFGPAKIFLCYLQRDTLQQDHHHCTRNQCKLADMPNGAYQTRHTSHGCHCSTILLDGAELAHSLRTGKTPLVHIDLEVQQPDGTFDERVTLETVHDEPYVAISHVWSHGLGNRFQNGLPECQLRRLKNYVVTLSATLGLDRVAYIWIDTLCIPVNEEFRDERRTAIEFLPQTFDKAQHVLVLDEELYSVSLNETSMMEIGLRILCSTWMRRVWTLAEGVQAVRFGAKRSLRGYLARVTYETTRLSFQLLEGSISYSCLSQMSRKSQLSRDHDSYYCCDLLWDALETRLPSFVMSDDLPHLSHRLREVSAALKFRRTSRITDEPVCIALLLGLPTLSITGEKTAARRMRELYVLIREFPMCIIFRTFDPRQPYAITTPECIIVDTEEKEEKGGIPVDGKDLAYSAHVNFSTNLDELPGFRWAPRSFLSDFPGISENLHDPKVAICDTNGLHGEYPGFIFDIDQGDRNNKIGESSCASPSLAIILSFSNLVLVRPGPGSGGDSWGQWVKFRWKKFAGIGDILGNSLTSSASSTLPKPFQPRAAIIFDGIGQLNDSAILGYVLANHESCPVTSNSMGRSHTSIARMSSTKSSEEQELRLLPLATGYVVKVGCRSDPQITSWHNSQFQPSLEIHGQSVSWRQKWCIV